MPQQTYRSPMMHFKISRETVILYICQTHTKKEGGGGTPLAPESSVFPLDYSTFLSMTSYICKAGFPMVAIYIKSKH